MTEQPEGPAAEAPQPTSEMAELRAQVDQLRQRLDRRERWTRRRRRARRGLVGVLVVLFSIGAVASLIGVWARQTVLKTDRFVAAVGPLPSDPDVSRALSDFLTAELFTELDIDRRAREALPDDLQFLVGPLDGIARDYTRDAIATVLTSDQFQRIWNDAVTNAHQLALRVLDGEDPPGVVRRDGEVVLDLLPAVYEIVQRIVEQGPGFLGDVQLPELDEDATRREIRRQLSDRFDIDLPQDFGEIVVFHEDRLSEVQDVVHLANRYLFIGVALTLLLGAGALLLSVDRRRTLLQLGLGTAVTTYLVFAVLRTLADDLADLVEEGENRDAAHAAAQIVSRGLRDRAWYLLIGGVVVAVVSYLFGPGRGAAWVRRTSRKVARQTREGAVAFPSTPAGQWVRTNVDGLRVGGAIAAFGFLLLFQPGWTGLFVLLVLLGAFEIGLSLYPRLGERPAD
ncbi:MAG TPA: hypothetical protein VF152_13870 [Acidimicrobiia bacterium]